MSIVELLRNAREARGWDQTELAHRLATSQSAVSFIEGSRRQPRLDIIERWLAATKHRVLIYPSVFADAVETAGAINDALATHDRDRAWRALLDFSDGLAVCVPVECVLLTATAPPLSTVPTWSAALAAVTEWRLLDRKLPVPPWVEEPRRALAHPEPLVISDYDLTPAIDEVPDAFARRNLLVAAGALRSA